MTLEDAAVSIYKPNDKIKVKSAVHLVGTGIDKWIEGEALRETKQVQSNDNAYRYPHFFHMMT